MSRMFGAPGRARTGSGQSGVDSRPVTPILPLNAGGGGGSEGDGEGSAAFNRSAKIAPTAMTATRAIRLTNGEKFCDVGVFKGTRNPIPFACYMSAQLAIANV